MNKMGLFLGSGDGVNGTNPHASHTAHTVFIIDNIIKQVLAFARPAFFIEYVLFVLFVKIV